MAKRRQCANCGEYNAYNAHECKSCSKEFGAYTDREVKAIATCSWTDHGSRCPCRGILSNTTNGEGSWYCREHWERLQGVEAPGRGNYPTASGRSALMRKWDGLHEQWLARRDRRTLPVPPSIEREIECNER